MTDMENRPTCIEPGCEKPAKRVSKTSKWFRKRCSMHEKRRETERATGTCNVPGCDKPRSQARAICKAHLSRSVRFGDLFPEIPVQERGGHVGGKGILERALEARQ